MFFELNHGYDETKKRIVNFSNISLIEMNEEKINIHLKNQDQCISIVYETHDEALNFYSELKIKLKNYAHLLFSLSS